MYDRVRLAFVHGNLEQSQKEAGEGFEQFRKSSPEWAFKFRLLQAESMLWRGLSDEALTVLTDQSVSSHDPESTITQLALLGAAYTHVGPLSKAASTLADADRLCSISDRPSCADVLRADGVLAIERGRLDEARQFFERTLLSARLRQDEFLEANALLNLGVTSLRQEFSDDCIDWSEKAYSLAVKLGAEDLAQTAMGNLGAAYYRLGDLEKAHSIFTEAEARAIQDGDVTNQVTWLTNLASIEADHGNYIRAQEIYDQALKQQIESKGDISEALRALARVSLKAGKLKQAKDYAQRAILVAQQAENPRDEVYPRLVDAQVDALQGNESQALQVFREIGLSLQNPPPIRWDAQHYLAQFYENRNQTESADKEYRAALSTFEAARDSVHHGYAQLSFLANAAGIYDDYLHFLIAHGRSDEALRWADYNRSRTLAEGLGLLGHGNEKNAPPRLNAQEVVRRAKGAVLFYWLGEKQSYLWAITPRKTALFTLPARAEIEVAAQNYRQSLIDPGDVLGSANHDGQWLYQTLVAPALPLLKNDERVFIIPDSSLNNVNFETFIVSDPATATASNSKPHFWIEDATITAASSLRVLAASNAARKKNNRKLLLIGNSVAPSKEYPELPQAAAQMDGVARHFTNIERQTFSRAQATPSAYLNSHPEQFSNIHFVAHGTASRLSPLDSAVVLSTAGGEDDFKLYARDIIHHPLRADLVTISACYSAGERSYAGEGLVGLSWAFLRAGAHNVVAALWEATDAPTEQLMNHFYDEIGKGATPDVALRAAKLSLLHSGPFADPFYWAPFQLYAGS